MKSSSGVHLRAARPGRPLLSRAFRLSAGILAAACAAVTAVLGALVAHQTRAGWLDRGIDSQIRAGLGGHPAVLTLVADLGSPLSVTLAAVATFAACLWTRRWRAALLVAVAVPAASLTELGLKPLVDRTAFGWTSYPSGHTIGAFSLAVTFAVLLIGPLHPPLPGAVRVLLAAIALALACAVAVAQVARGAHYFTDTLGGAAVAAATVLLTALIIDVFAERRSRAACAGRLTRPS
jgi:membrane-associated phospholipid phosphatase